MDRSWRDTPLEKANGVPVAEDSADPEGMSSISDITIQYSNGMCELGHNLGVR
jgi:hypothetical protein